MRILIFMSTSIPHVDMLVAYPYLCGNCGVEEINLGMYIFTWNFPFVAMRLLAPVSTCPNLQT